MGKSTNDTNGKYAGLALATALISVTAAGIGIWLVDNWSTDSRAVRWSAVAIFVAGALFGLGLAATFARRWWSHEDIADYNARTILNSVGKIEAQVADFKSQLDRFGASLSRAEKLVDGGTPPDNPPDNGQ